MNPHIASSVRPFYRWFVSQDKRYLRRAALSSQLL